jgi:hypothetical protein
LSTKGGRARHRRTNNFIDNVQVRIIGNGGEKKKRTGKLTVAASYWKIASGEWWWRDLIPFVE